jgi:uncharacterized protein (DUF1800 family)
LVLRLASTLYTISGIAMNVFVNSFTRRAFALAAALTLLSQSLVAFAQTPARKPSMSEEQRVVHVLNRLGFGARPGDVERVRRMGLEKYIEQQLNPASVDDAATEARLKRFPTLAMTNAELLAKYPNPGQLIRRLQRRGELPADLADLAGQRPGAARRNAPPQTNGQMNDQTGDQMAGPPPPMQMEAEPATPNDDNPERAEYRRRIREYMREQGMEPPQRIVQELQAARVLRAVYSERQLQEVLVDFWSNHFNVFAQKGADRWFLTSYDRDVIRPNALGNFRDLLEATAASPAMLFYLDNFQSMDPNAQQNRRRALRRQLGLEGEDADARGGRNPRRAERRAMRRQQRQQESAGGQEMPRRPPQQRMRRGINENYARELMELHTLGVEGGYTQKDVQEVARAFTGWTIIDPRGRQADGRGGSFVFNARMHDDGEKVVLGQKIPAGGGIEDGRRVLDILVRHPSTAKFISTKLARRFVSDNPSAATVERAAAAFRQSNGDIKATLRALFNTPEFNSAEARRAKIKTPFELAVSAIRTLGAETDARPALAQWIARMGEPLYMYQAPTGYPDTAEHWVNTGALLERLNFALALVSNRIPGTRVELARFAGDAATSSRAVDQARVVDQFLAHVLQGDISPRSREVLMKQLSDQRAAPVSETPADEDAAVMRDARDEGARRERRAARRARRDAAPTVGNPEVARIAALIIGSPEFQRQ